MLKILSLPGTRPQFIKSIGIDRACKERGVEHHIFSMEQSWDWELSKLMFTRYQIHIRIFDPYAMKEVDPDIVLVYGDCKCTLEGAGIAYKYNYPLAHVEAGLRCGEPTVEEYIRSAVDHCSQYNFAPTRTAEINLRSEDVRGEIVFTGDVLFDLFAKPEPSNRAGTFNLVTIHRRETVDNWVRFNHALNMVERPAVWPIHPHAQKHLEEFKLDLDGVDVIPPVEHNKMLQMIVDAKKVFTDSGGVYREALWAGKHVVSLRRRHEFEGCTAEDFGDGHAAEKVVDCLGSAN